MRESIGEINNGSNAIRVWKGILGIRDLTKIRCGIRENAKYLDGIRDLSATWEAGFAKIWERDAGFFCFFCLPRRRRGRGCSCKLSIQDMRTRIGQDDPSRCPIVLFHHTEARKTSPCFCDFKIGQLQQSDLWTASMPRSKVTANLKFSGTTCSKGQEIRSHFSSFK